MDLRENGANAVRRMLDHVPGMKVLLVDEDTSGIISLLLSQSQALESEVFLVVRLDKEMDEPLTHLKAIVFVRPSHNNFSLLKRHLNRPVFSEYHLFFSNVVDARMLQDLASCDRHESVKTVLEFYCDSFVVLPSLVSLNVSGVLPSSFSTLKVHRITEGILSVLLSLGARPHVRYQSNSELCNTVAESLQCLVDDHNQLFRAAASTVPPLLLVLDRCADAVTPLLMQWSYVAMAHELFGFDNNRIVLHPNSQESRELAMSPWDDEFYAEHLFSTFGDLGTAVKGLVDQLQSHSPNVSAIESIADMQRVVERFPEYRNLSNAVSKHVAVVGEMSRVVESRALLDTSEIEQMLACEEGMGTAFREVLALLNRPEPTPRDKVRSVCLYALRYQNQSGNRLSELLAALEAQAGQGSSRTVSELMSFGGSARRVEDIFHNQSILAVATSSIRRSLRGAQSVYTQHEPLLASIVDNAARGKLKPSDYPFVRAEGNPAAIPQVIIVAMLGGTTFAEASVVRAFNTGQLRSKRSVHVALIGTTIHNSESFLDSICPPLVTRAGPGAAPQEGPRTAAQTAVGAFETAVDAVGGAVESAVTGIRNIISGGDSGRR